MRTIRLILEYDGSSFHGWQVQGRGAASDPRTVQGAIEAALHRMTGEVIRVRAASRTDAGVHARGQVVAFDTGRDGIPLRGFERGLTGFLPPSVVVRKAEVAESGLHPRRVSRGKHYRYTFWNDRLPSALDRNRAWFEPRPMNIERMQEAASVLVGTHDFEAFRSAGCQAKHAVRTLYRVEVSRGEYARLHLDVVGNAFVRNMVRIIAGNLRDVGIGKSNSAELHRLLESRDRALGGMTAPPQGLCLEEVIFDDRLPARPRDDVHFIDEDGDDDVVDGEPDETPVPGPADSPIGVE